MWTAVVSFILKTCPWLIEKAWPWVQKNGKHLGWPAACILGLLYFRSCGVIASLGSLQDSYKLTNLTQNSSLTATAKASSTGSVTIPGRPAMPCPPSKTCPECPGVVLNFGSSSETELKGTQTQIGKIGVEKPFVFNVAIGGGAWAVPEIRPYAGILLNYKDLTANLQADLEGHWGVGGYWTLYSR